MSAPSRRPSSSIDKESVEKCEVVHTSKKFSPGSRDRRAPLSGFWASIHIRGEKLMPVRPVTLSVWQRAGGHRGLPAATHKFLVLYLVRTASYNKVARLGGIFTYWRA